MDLRTVVKNRSLEREESNKRVIFFGPHPDVIPTDDILSYHTLTTVYSVADLESHSIVFVSAEAIDIAELILANQDIFDLAAVEITGVPGADYMSDWRNVSWRMVKRVDHPALLSEYAMAYQAAAESRPKVDKELARVTNSAGKIKDFSSFEVNDGHNGAETTDVDV